MIKPVIVNALNAQIQNEMSNAHAYQAVAVFFGHLNLHGFEAFMARQSAEERNHAERFLRHLAARGVRAELGAIPAPKGEFASALEACHAVRDWERTTTDQIHKLFDLARREGDVALEILLHWFIAEQVEEEQWSGELSELAGWFHERPGQLFMLDHHWAKRMENPK